MGALESSVELLKLLAMVGRPIPESIATYMLYRLRPDLRGEHSRDTWAILRLEALITIDDRQGVRLNEQRIGDLAEQLLRQEPDKARLHDACAEGLLRLQEHSGLQLAGTIARHLNGASRAQESISLLGELAERYLDGIRPMSVEELKTLEDAPPRV